MGRFVVQEAGHFYIIFIHWFSGKGLSVIKITIICERFIVLMWKHLKFQLFCFFYLVVNVGSVFTEAQPGSTLTALCFEIAYSLLRKIVEREFQILTLMNFHEPLEIKCNFQQPSSSDSPLLLLRFTYYATPINIFCKSLKGFQIWKLNCFKVHARCPSSW